MIVHIVFWRLHAEANGRTKQENALEMKKRFFALAQRMGLDTLTMDFQAVFPIHPVPLATSGSYTTDDLIELLTAHGRIPLQEVKQHPGGSRFDEPAVFVEPADANANARFELAHPHMLADLDEIFDRMDQLGAVDAAFPFRLICQRTTRAYNSSCIDESTHRSRLYNPAYMHPEDLAALGLQRGDVARIESDSGFLMAIVDSDPHLRLGVVALSHGYGAVDLEAAQLAITGVNVNRLLRNDGQHDRRSGQPLMSNVPVRVMPVPVTE